MNRPREPDRLDVSRQGKALVIRLPRQVAEEDDVQPLGQHLLALADAERPPYLVVSLADVEQAGTALVGRLVMLHKRVEAAGGRLALCRLPEALRGLLEQTRLMSFFHVYATEDEAVQGL
jgi:anti-anti-sigma factor